MSQPRVDLSIVIPALHEEVNLRTLLPELKRVLAMLDIDYEIIIVDETADQAMRMLVQEHACILVSPNTRGYGAALIAGFKSAQGQYIVTMDADLSHSPDFLISMWKSRQEAEIIIASRYDAGGKAVMPVFRYLLSRILNMVFSRGLDLRLADMSSGFRLYKASVIHSAGYGSNDFNLLQEILVKALLDGYRVREIPFTYLPRKHGSSHARILKFGMKYLQTFSRLWKLRNSIASADYDARAFDTFMLPQRYWQRKRYDYITRLVNKKTHCLDVGCGSSRILDALPAGSIGLDIQLRKLRYARRYHKSYLNASATALPIAKESVESLICSQVIEHIAPGEVLSELDRVLKPGGRLILGTPDYGKWQWNLIEKLYKLILPQAYADEHITHYTLSGLLNEFVTLRGYILEHTFYILQGEVILSFRKPDPN